MVSLMKSADLVKQARLRMAQRYQSEPFPHHEFTGRLYLPIARLYQETSSHIDHNGSFYDLNYIFQATELTRVEQIAVHEVKWILRHCDGLDPDRVKRADLTIPILVCKYRNKELVIDGLHRLAKAILVGQDKLPYKRVTKDVFEHSRMSVPSIEHIPTFTTW